MPIDLCSDLKLCLNGRRQCVFTEMHPFAKESCSSSGKCLIQSEQSDKVNFKMTFIEFKNCELKALGLN